MTYDRLVCANCAAPVSEGRCPVCRANRERLQQENLFAGTQPHGADRTAGGADRGGGAAGAPDRIARGGAASKDARGARSDARMTLRAPRRTSSHTFRARSGYRQAAAPPRPPTRRGRTRKPMPPAIIVAAPISRKVVWPAPVSASSPPLPWPLSAEVSEPVSVRRPRSPASWAEVRSRRRGRCCCRRRCRRCRCRRSGPRVGGLRPVGSVGSSVGSRRLRRRSGSVGSVGEARVGALGGSVGMPAGPSAGRSGGSVGSVGMTGVRVRRVAPRPVVDVDADTALVRRSRRCPARKRHRRRSAKHRRRSPHRRLSARHGSASSWSSGCYPQ